MRPAALVALLLSALAPAGARAAQVNAGGGETVERLLVDLGAEGTPSGCGATCWNDAWPGTQGDPIALSNTDGIATGAALGWVAGAVLWSANGSGTASPAPGSPLDVAGYPPDAVRDSFYGANSNPLGQLVLSGLDPSGVHDFTFTASRMGVSDDRSTLYHVAGSNAGAAVLDPAGNDTEVVGVGGILPDASGSITISVSAAPQNDNASGFFYLGVVDVVVTHPDRKNLLFYGNSYSAYNGGVPTLVRHIAQEAGFASPLVVAKLVGGKDLEYHLTNTGQAAAIAGSLPPGQSWDHVVLQGYSLEATTSLSSGDQAGFVAAAAALHANVAAHSPGVRSVLYQTWARGFGSWVYAGSAPAYAHPAEMHAEVRTGYHLADVAIDAGFGAGSCRVAPVGDGFAQAGWSGDLYLDDASHPTARGTLLAAQVIFSTLYAAPLCAVSPGWAAGSSLAQHLAGLGLGADDWDAMAALADAVAYGPLVPWPGSGEDLVLASGVGGAVGSCPQSLVQPLDPLTLRVHSPHDAYGGAPYLLVAHPLAAGSDPVPLPGFPEVHVDPGHLAVLLSGSLPAGGAALTLSVPSAAAVGTTVRTQAFALAPSALAANPYFTATNALQLVVQ